MLIFLFLPKNVSDGKSAGERKYNIGYNPNASFFYLTPKRMFCQFWGMRSIWDWGKTNFVFQAGTGSRFRHQVEKFKTQKLRRLRKLHPTRERDTWVSGSLNNLDRAVWNKDIKTPQVTAPNSGAGLPEKMSIHK